MYKIYYGLIGIIVLMLIGCGHFGINIDSPEKKYLAARSELNLLLEQYIQVQDKVSNSNHEIAKTAFKTADTALDAWHKNLFNESYDFTKDIRAWIQAKNTIIQIIREVYNE